MRASKELNQILKTWGAQTILVEYAGSGDDGSIEYVATRL